MHIPWQFDEANALDFCGRTGYRLQIPPRPPKHRAKPAKKAARRRQKLARRKNR